MDATQYSLLKNAILPEIDDLPTKFLMPLTSATNFERLRNNEISFNNLAMLYFEHETDRQTFAALLAYENKSILLALLDDRQCNLLLNTLIARCDISLTTDEVREGIIRVINEELARRDKLQEEIEATEKKLDSMKKEFSLFHHDHSTTIKTKDPGCLHIDRCILF